MIAINTPDRVLYCGDAVFGEETVKKHPILYYTFIGDALNSFKKLRDFLPSVDVAVIYHGGIISDLSVLIDDHERSIHAIKDKVLNLIQEAPQSLEDITAKIMSLYNIPDNLIAYTLTKTPMQAYLAELESENLVEIRVTEGVSRAYTVNKET